MRSPHFEDSEKWLGRVEGEHSEVIKHDFDEKEGRDQDKDRRPDDERFTGEKGPVFIGENEERSKGVVWELAGEEKGE